jgi:integrase/recombinase XerD
LASELYLFFPHLPVFLVRRYKVSYTQTCAPSSDPLSFRELLALHMEQMHAKGAIYLFESVRKHKYTERGVRKMLARYAAQAGITRSMSPHKWRHFLFTWLKKEGIDDALIQPYSGHATRQSLEIYSRLSLADAQPSYNQAMERFPIQ